MPIVKELVKMTALKAARGKKLRLKMLKCVLKKIRQYFEQNSDDKKIKLRVVALDMVISRISENNLHTKTEIFHTNVIKTVYKYCATRLY